MNQTRSLEVFNKNMPLTVVLLDGVDKNGVQSMGVVDETMQRVWVEMNITSSRVRNRTALPTVDVPHIPERYGEWVHTSIGGISSTVRRAGIIKFSGGRDASAKPTTVFAINAPAANSITVDTFVGIGVTLGDTEQDEMYGYVTEVIVHRASDVTYVAARIARAGASPLLENDGSGTPSSTKRSIGVERLDRIGARVTGESSDLLGLRRGTDNWYFWWLPSGWEVPITWDHMVRNISDSSPIHDIPQPLRQHVARSRLERGRFPHVGSKWTRTSPPSIEELKWNAQADPKAEPPLPLRRIVTLSQADTSRIDTDEPLEVRVDLRTLANVDGVWYRPCDTRRFLEQHIPSKRWVSGKLDSRQSKQIIEAFYLLTVERVTDPIVHKAVRLILFHYMKERGYTARWMGKYEQDARHVGNGDKFRKFSRLEQYAPHRLPTEVLNRLCGKDGKLLNRGSKGSRSKHCGNPSRAYVPKHRLVRTKEDERRMTVCT